MAPIQTPQIPIIDLSAFVSGDDPTAKQQAADSLVQACHRLGFVAITNHGLSQSHLNSAFSWSKRLFDLPLSEKMKAPHPIESTPHRGYSHPGKEKVYGYGDLEEKEVNESKGQSLRKIPDFKESYEIGSENDLEQPNIWLPEDVLPGYKDFMLDFYWTLNGVADRILEAFIIGMRLDGEEASFLKKLNSRDSNQLRLLHYPEVPREKIEGQEIARMPAHTDWGSFTLLFQDDCGGLELEDPQARGTYLSAKPMEGALLLNIGDFFMRLTNDYFISATHRVTLPPLSETTTADVYTTKPRYSIPYFVSPPSNLVAAALPTFVSEKNPAKYEPCTFAEYAAHISKYQYGGPTETNEALHAIWHQTASAGQFTEIPTIDLSPITSSTSSPEYKARLVKELYEACTRVGFFVIKNHGIDWKVVDDAFDGLKEFFDLPMEKKMEVHQSLSDSYQGYEQPYFTNVDRLKKGDLKESLTTGYDPYKDPHGVGDAMPEILRRHNLWPNPKYAPKLQPAVDAYRAACLGLMRKLVRIMAVAMGEKEDYFDKKVTYPIAGIQALYYAPQAASEEEETGLGAHTDVQLMTMIAQKPFDVQALQVLNASGEWIRLSLQPETFVVNLGDMMGRLTNDTFLSTVHRVCNKDTRGRYSMPFFFGLNNDELTTTLLPQFVTTENPLKEGYEKGMTGYEHYNNRLQMAHHKHPSAVNKVSSALPPGMTKVDGIIVDGL